MTARALLATWSLRALLVSTLLASVAGQAHAADAWESLGPARIGATFDEVSQQAALACGREAARRVCTVSSPVPIIFAGLPVARIEAVFGDSRLEQVKVTLGNQHYEDLYRALTARYGEGEDCSVLARAGMSASSGAQIRRQMFLRLYSADMPGDRLRERAIRAIEGWRPR